jgi:hypothetical protein
VEEQKDVKPLVIGLSAGALTHNKR